jgi:hypothetical protein
MITEDRDNQAIVAMVDQFRRFGLRLPQSQKKRGPFWRIIFAVDVKNSTDRTNPGRAEFRDAIYSMMQQSLAIGRITERRHDRPLDRGDGILVLIHQSDEIPHTRLLDTVVPHFRELLQKYAADKKDGRPLQLRAVLHAGLVHRDPWSWYGEEIDIAFRLLNAPDVKDLFKDISDPLLLVVSDLIYQSIVSHDYPGIDRQEFAPIATVRIRDRQCTGWAITPPRKPTGKFDGDIGGTRPRKAHRAKRVRPIDPLAPS